MHEAKEVSDMKGVNTWSFKPYKPFLFDTGDIYICRLAPEKCAIHLEWLPIGAEQYQIYCRTRNAGDYALMGETTDCAYTITALDDQTDYEFYVEALGKRSRVRLARTGTCEGTVINYLHPDDKCYSYAGQYLGSPSLLRCPDGSLLCTMDLFQMNKPMNLTLLFRSRDDGQTWHYVSDIYPCLWPKLFVHRNEVYLLSVATQSGDLLIGKSTDMGETFSMPTVLLRGSIPGHPGLHKANQNVMHANGRIWATLEWGCWINNFGFSVMVMSCDENADLLCAENWHFTPPVPYNPAWPGTAKGPSTGNIEGTLTLFPDGNLYNVMRYSMQNCTPCYGKALVYRVNTDDPDAPLCYDHAMDFPANHSKFIIQQDEQTGLYYTIANRISGPESINARNLLSLMVSPDCENWRTVCDLIDYRDHDPALFGFQYVDFLFSGDDILYQCRTSMNGADTFHNSNYATFHRIKDFRALGK